MAHTDAGRQRWDFRGQAFGGELANHANGDLICGANRLSTEKLDFHQFLAFHMPAQFINQVANDLFASGIDHIT